MFLLHDPVVSYDVEHDVGGYDRNAVDFFVGEKLVRDLDDAFPAHLVAFQVVADGYFAVQRLQVEQGDYLEHFSGGDMVDDCTLLEGCDLQFFFHEWLLFSCGGVI